MARTKEQIKQQQATSLPPAPKATPLEKRLAAMKDMDMADFESAIGHQMTKLPAPRAIPQSAQAIAGRLGKLLQLAELRRIRGTKNVMLYPVEWKNNKCTGHALELCRVTKNTRQSKKDGKDEPNPNYGRFFFARRVPLFESDGSPKKRSFIGNDGEIVDVDDTKLSNFTWFTDSALNTTGALDVLTKEMPNVAALLRGHGGVSWDGFDEVMYLHGLSDDQLVDKLMGARPPPQPRKKRARIEGDDDEEEEEEEDDEED